MRLFSPQPKTYKPESEKRGFKPRTKGLNPVSAKRRAVRPARRELREEVVARDERCQFPRLVEAYLPVASPDDIRQLAKAPECGGDLVPHEPKHSHNVGRLNLDETTCLCVIHNTWVEGLGSLAYRIGVLERGTSYPLKHVQITDRETTNNEREESRA